MQWGRGQLLFQDDLKFDQVSVQQQALKGTSQRGFLIEKCICSLLVYEISMIQSLESGIFLKVISLQHNGEKSGLLLHSCVKSECP